MAEKLNSSSLGQEMAAQTAQLERQRRERESRLIDITLESIVAEMESKEQDILQAVSERGARLQSVRDIIETEVMRACADRLWCPRYVEKLGSEQHMKVYTGSHWEEIESQQWRDFVGACAKKCGATESMCMNHVFMNQLTEGMSFVLAKGRKQHIPENEVWLNLRNGTLVLKGDGELQLREHRKEDLFTYTLSYVYDPQADCELWHRFLDRVLPEPESQQVLREFIAYCLMKDHRFEKMLMLYGDGLNGKSVTLEIIEYLLGSMNVSYLSLSDLTNDEVKRAGIEGKKLNISHESGKDVNPNALKQLTSGEPVLIKHLYVDPRETSNYGKLIAAFNQLPLAENTFGFFRRIIILPYEVTIPDNEIDRQLSAKLKMEISGILNWVLEALPLLLSRKAFTISAKCERSMERYRMQSDSVKLFLKENCAESELPTKGSELFGGYRNYCYSSGLKPIGKQRFFERLERLGYHRETDNGCIYFKIRIAQV